MNPQDLHRASFRGVPFLVTSAGLAGGRRLVRKLFPHSDRQALEDLGLDPDGFTISGVVAAQRDPSGAEIKGYREVRNALIKALKSRESGVLVHPFLGRFKKISVIRFNLTESMTSLGSSPIEITFSTSDSDALPKITESVVGSITVGLRAVLAAAKDDVKDRFKVTKSFSGNFGDAVTKTTAVLAAVRAAVKVIASKETAIDAFDLRTQNYEDSIFASIVKPEDLGEDTVDLINSIPGLYADSADALSSLSRLFVFGDDDTTITQNTSGRIQRVLNRNVVNSAVQSSALSQAYLAAAKLTFATTDDIDTTAEILENQWQKLLPVGIMGEDLEESVAKLRVSTNLFFDQERDLRPKVITIRTNLTSTRLLAYRFYGESTQGDTIAKLNGFSDGAGIEGDVKVLSA